MTFLPCPESNIHKQNDPEDLRIGDLLKKESLEKFDFVLAGYPDDEGIKLNGGRPGAAQAPNVIRQKLTRMTPNQDPSQFKAYFDIGNLSLESDLNLRHEFVIKEGKKHLSNKKKWIGLGGGHDYAYADGAAFLQCFSTQKPIIINFDAHLDVRPTHKGLTSGTPFYRLLNDYSDFDFYEIGIQEECNSLKHRDWCQKKGGKILFYKDLYNSLDTPFNNFKSFLSELTNSSRPTYLSVDIDAFSSSFAMGCSQSWPMGIIPNDFHNFMDFLLNHLNIVSLGIYEVSPPLDLDDRTSKLAAQIIYRYLAHG
ncbi:MAG: formimidoylglutamase [Bdellovibrionaceae bacterium]|nr:formimidoylglutamase [Pseudobdellovibrionaceae bacterium]